MAAQALGYKVTLLFFWLHDVNLATERVKLRVAAGGHNIPGDVIKRRYQNGLSNLLEIYFDICDRLIIADNSDMEYDLIAQKNKGADITIVSNSKWQTLKENVDGKQ
ncbi:hypothetical protein [Foetidibacter luteolus]|uniref:hypothetical protein n=1 Tax=Foetidibacter luteolus TaxID=2608880 RepID=UPI00129B8B74|nr:hypothetical protein [Foetidibacter luteolus]